VSEPRSVIGRGAKGGAMETRPEYVCWSTRRRAGVEFVLNPSNVNTRPGRVSSARVGPPATRSSISSASASSTR